jgi:hypothetical protein
LINQRAVRTARGIPLNNLTSIFAPCSIQITRHPTNDPTSQPSNLTHVDD